MRTLILLAGFSAALAGCASESARQQASLQCQQVGITEGASDYGTCTQAYVAQQREKSLDDNYRRAINAYPVDRRIPHFELY